MFFDHVKQGPPDPIFGLNSAFKADLRKNKVYLSVGYYKDAEDKSFIMRCIRDAQKEVIQEEVIANYLPFDGDAQFTDAAGELILGKELWNECKNRTYIAQSIGGTGSLRIGGEFLEQELKTSIYLPLPTWPNHKSVFEKAGLRVENYPYYQSESHGFDFMGMSKSIDLIPEKSVIILQASCHNPTGSDPTFEQWKSLSSQVKERKILPYFDLAYQGFGKGIDEDAASIRQFVKDGHTVLVSCTFSKNFSLYCQRVGVLLVVCDNPDEMERVGSQIKRIIRVNYSNPPAHGAHLVQHVLRKPENYSIWKNEVGEIRNRLTNMRLELVDRLNAKTTSLDYSYLKERKGMFCFLDLNKDQVARLIHEYGIYLTGNGRINVSGLFDHNIDYVADSIIAVTLPK